VKLLNHYKTIKTYFTNNTIRCVGYKDMKIRRIYGASLIGSCRDCGQQFEDNNKPKEAYYHAKKTGHKVSIEKTVNIYYN